MTAPDPDYLFWTEGHALGFTMLRYGVMSCAQITVVTGAVGAGKTTLMRQLLRETAETLTVGLVSNLQAGRGELLHWIMMALDQPLAEEPYVATFQKLQDFVVQSYAAGNRVVLIIDEAQNMSVSQLEELRMLSNINAEKNDLLQIILLGQPQLRDMLRQPELTQFMQRVSSDFHLDPMSATETTGYVNHRLDIAGATWRIFPQRTCDLIHESAGGVPRLVNTLCDLCLIYGFATEQKVIDEGLLREFLSGAAQRGIYPQFATLGDAPRLVKEAR